MAKVNLTSEEKAGLIEAINKGVEPKPDLLQKLFPGTAEKFDVQALDRAKIPTLEYAGKRSKSAILAEAHAGIGAAPLQTVRCFGETKNGEWKNLIVQGDNLQFLKTCYRNVDPLIKNKVKGKVKLICIDPPFATKSDFGSNEGERSYSDKVDTAEFIEALRERLIYQRELLDNDGSVYLHLDQKMSHYVKIIMDEVFGKENFLNEVIWMRSANASSIGKIWKRAHDTVLNYACHENYIFNIQRKPLSEASLKLYTLEDDRGKYRLVPLLVSGTRNGETGKPWRGIDPNKRGRNGMHWVTKQTNLENYTRNGLVVWPNKEDGAPNLKYYLDDNTGVAVTDLWDDIAPVGSGNLEFENYPTQKPESLLERIILASSNPGDLVMDIFGGSGTTAAVAEKLGRRWITCDFGKHAIYTMQKRLLRIGESKALVDEQDNSGKVIVKKGEPYKNAPKKFAVVSSGAYDFSHVMDLRKHKETYLDFVLGLFSLVRDEEKTKKYKLANIYAIKDNNPVEVYPVWDDQFLKQVKIDEAYLRGIITQSGGKLKGEYYIITPESCTNLGDTTLKNQDGKDIHFQMLTFPYKVLEDDP